MACYPSARKHENVGLNQFKTNVFLCANLAEQAHQTFNILNVDTILGRVKSFESIRDGENQNRSDQACKRP